METNGLDGPSVKAFLVAEQVFRKESAVFNKPWGQWCVVGILNRIVGSLYPIVVPRFGVFLVLQRIGIERPFKAEVQLRNAKLEVLGTISQHEGCGTNVPGLQWAHGWEEDARRPIPGRDPLMIPEPGEYLFMLNIDGEPASALKLEAVKP